MESLKKRLMGKVYVRTEDVRGRGLTSLQEVSWTNERLSDIVND